MSKFNLALHHVSVIVANTNKSLEFYCGILGLKQVTRPELPYPGAWLQLGPQQIHLLELENPDPTKGRPEHGGRDRHFALTTPSITPIKEALDHENIRYSMSKSGRSALFCRDRDGNTVEIIEQIF